MKKFFLSFCVLLYACLSAVTLFACDLFSSDYDYEKTELKISQRQEFAPCSLQEFVMHNKHANKYFEFALSHEYIINTWETVTVNGEDWKEKRFTEYLPEGRYDIVLQSSKHYEHSVHFPDYESKTLTIAVNVSKAFDDLAPDYDYLAEELVIKDAQSFAPCSFNEFVSYNPYTKQYLEFALNTASRVGWSNVVIDGKEWSNIDLVMNELPVGIYKIVIDTTGMTMRTHDENGNIVELPYNRKITIPVVVSPLHKDLYVNLAERGNN